ncbi:MAG: hypothetical protein HY306_07165 [Nitrosomonadales bacterium]|nr:hypothetical protein [Nitrosomonadales bacterium]
MYALLYNTAFHLSSKPTAMPNPTLMPAGGKGTAHQVINTGSVDLKYLAVSTNQSPEIAEYPDTGKFGVLAEFPAGTDGKPRGIRFVGRENQGVDYWEGE